MKSIELAPERVEIETIVLENIRLSISQGFSSTMYDVLDRSAVRVAATTMGDAFLWNIETVMLGNQERIEREEAVPLTWHDHAKYALINWRRWNGRIHRWLSRRLAVNMRRIKASTHRVWMCPHLPTDPSQSHVRFCMMKDTRA